MKAYPIELRQSKLLILFIMTMILIPRSSKTIGSLITLVIILNLDTMHKKKNVNPNKDTDLFIIFRLYFKSRLS